MAQTIRELLVSIGVDADVAAVRMMGDVLNGLTRVAKGAAVATAAVGAAAAAAGASAFALAKRTADYIDAQYDASQRASIGVGAFTELGYSAQLAGTSIEALEGVLRRGALSIREATSGQGEAADAFRALGVRVTDATGRIRSQEAILRDVADGIQHTRSETEQLALVTAIYGRSGAEILPMLREGSKGLAEQAARARALGVVITDTEAAIAGRFNDAVDDARHAVGGLSRQIGLALMPALTGLIERALDWFTANRDVIRQRVDLYIRRVEGAVVTLTRWFTEADQIVKRTFGSWRPIILGVASAFAYLAFVLGSAKLLPTVISLGTALGSLSTALGGVAAIVGLPVWALLGIALAVVLQVVAILVYDFVVLGGAVALVVLYFDDLLTTLRGGDSVWRRVLDRFGLGEVTVNSLRDALSQLTAMWREYYGLLSDVATIARQELDPAIQAVGNAIDTYLVQPITRALNGLRELRDAAGEVLARVAGGALSLPSLQAQSAASAAAGVRGRIADARAALAPRVAAAQAPAGNVATSVQFGPTTINGVGMTSRDAEALLEATDRRRRRMALDATAGAEM